MKSRYAEAFASIAFAILLLMFAALPAVGQQKPKNPPASHPAAAAKPAAHPAGQASHPGGAGHPGGAASNNRAGSPNGMNRGASGNANSMGRGPANGAGHTAGNASAHGMNGNANAGMNRGGAGAKANAKGTSNVGAHGNAAGGNARGGATASVSRHQPTGTKSVAMSNGGHATFRSDGHVRSVQTHGMTINHGMHGERHIVSQHNGRQVVVTGHNGGYSQRAYYRHGGNVYVQRTYYHGGRVYAYGYRSYYYGGYPYYGYAPAYYYQPVYYGWAYNPWPAPVYYNWGWAGQPWYGYYGPYYQPYPAYPSAAFWLTDYLLAENLRLAYEARAAAGLAPRPFESKSEDLLAELWSTDPLVTANLSASYPHTQFMLGTANPSATNAQMPADVKQAISEQIKLEIAAEKDAAANKDKTAETGEHVPPALDPNTRYFVVSSDQDLTTSDGNECTLTAGDVIYRTGDAPDDDKMVDATVKSAKKDECAVGATVGVEVSELQEMHNALRQTMDEGLKKLAENSGKNGLPAAPDTKTTQGEVPAPTADNNVADDLQQTQKDADQAEAELQKPN